MKESIVNFASDQGVTSKPPLKKVLSEEQMEQIKYADEHNVPWHVVARYFKEEHGLNYHEDTYRRLLINR